MREPWQMTPDRSCASRRLARACCAALLLLGGCPKEMSIDTGSPRFIPNVGGQSGQEGSCAWEDNSPLSFDPAAVAERIVGHHESQLRWNQQPEAPTLSSPNAPATQDISFDVSARGERVVSAGCGGPSVFLDVDVQMQIPESGVNVTFAAVAQAFRRLDILMVSAVLDPSLRNSSTVNAQDLASATSGVTMGSPPEAYYFDMWFYEDQFSGHLAWHKSQPDSYQSCGIAIWPEAYCDTHFVPMNTAPSGFDMAAVVQRATALSGATLQWEDGTSSVVQLEVEPLSGPLCVGAAFPRSEQDTEDDTEVQAPIRIHVVTTDDQVDAWLEGAVTVELTPAGTWDESLELEAYATGRPAAFAAAGARVPSGNPDELVGVSVQAGRAATGDWVRVYASGYPNPPTPVPDGVSAGRRRELSCLSGDSTVTTLLEGSSGNPL
jgi:hypothetical protein